MIGGFVVVGGITYYMVKKNKLMWGIFAGAIAAMIAPPVVDKTITVAKPKKK